MGHSTNILGLKAGIAFKWQVFFVSSHYFNYYRDFTYFFILLRNYLYYLCTIRYRYIWNIKRFLLQNLKIKVDKFNVPYIKIYFYDEYFIKFTRKFLFYMFRFTGLRLLRSRRKHFNKFRRRRFRYKSFKYYFRRKLRLRRLVRLINNRQRVTSTLLRAYGLHYAGFSGRWNYFNRSSINFFNIPLFNQQAYYLQYPNIEGRIFNIIDSHPFKTYDKVYKSLKVIMKKRKYRGYLYELISDRKAYNRFSSFNFSKFKTDNKFKLTYSRLRKPYARLGYIRRMRRFYDILSILLSSFLRRFKFIFFKFIFKKQSNRLGFNFKFLFFVFYVFYFKNRKKLKRILKKHQQNKDIRFSFMFLLGNFLSIFIYFYNTVFHIYKTDSKYKYFQKKTLDIFLRKRVQLTYLKFINYIFYIVSTRFWHINILFLFKKFIKHLYKGLSRFFYFKLRDFFSRLNFPGFNLKIENIKIYPISSLTIIGRYALAYTRWKFRRKFSLNEIVWPFMRYLKRRNRKCRFIWGFFFKGAGRFTRKQRADLKKYFFGKIPFSTYHARLTYHYMPLITKYGMCGLRIWLNFNKKLLYRNYNSIYKVKLF